MKMTLPAHTLLTLSLLAGPGLLMSAHAAPPPPSPMEHFIGPPPASADTNGDGRISKTEAQAARSAEFTTADTDASGGLSLAELAASLEARWNTRFSALDVDASGSLSLTEWLEARSGRATIPLTTLHRVGDEDLGGDLSKQEFLALALKVAHPVLPYVGMDKDGSGEISQTEFMAVKLPPPPRVGGQRQPSR
jgi:hypothetical protein